MIVLSDHDGDSAGQDAEPWAEERSKLLDQVNGSIGRENGTVKEDGIDLFEAHIQTLQTSVQSALKEARETHDLTWSLSMLIQRMLNETVVLLLDNRKSDNLGHATNTERQRLLHATCIVCGPVPALMAGEQVLRQLATADNGDLAWTIFHQRVAIFHAAVRLLHHFTCARPPKVTTTSLALLPHDAATWWNRVLAVPLEISNAHGALQKQREALQRRQGDPKENELSVLVLPEWTRLEWFRARLVECATLTLLQLDSGPERSTEAYEYWACLVQRLAGYPAGADAVVAGLRSSMERHLQHVKGSEKCLSMALKRLHGETLSARDSALLCARMIRCSQGIDDALLHISCLPALERSQTIRQSVVSMLVLSPGSVLLDETEDAAVMERLVECLARAIASCSDEDDEDNVLNNSPDSNHCILSHLTDVAAIWSTTAFVRHTESRLQRHVSTFLLALISHLAGDVNLTSRWMESIMSGVSERLCSSIHSIRIDGMLLADALSTHIGEKIEFEELQEYRSSRNHGEQETAASVDPIETPSQTFSLPTQLQGDDEDDDSVWSGDPIGAYEVDDDEQDLRQVPRPVFLLDCLSLLRTTDDAEDAYHAQVTALEALPQLVRSRPSDLADVGPSLALELARLENKFDVPNFQDKLVDSLTSLVVMEPVKVGETLIRQIFESGTLTNRLCTLTVLAEGARELCGETKLKDIQLQRQKHR
jgi:Telomere length regulation protein